LETFLANAFAVRFARGISASFYTTLIGGPASGVSAAATTITPDNLFDLLDSIASAYLSSAKVAWLMRRSTLTYIRKLKDTAGEPVAGEFAVQ
jgi:HK97 family phage major capsid protein